MTRPGPPGELWLAPPRSARRAWVAFAVGVARELLELVATLLLLSLLMSACTGAGSSCADDGACPPGWICEERKCAPPQTQPPAAPEPSPPEPPPVEVAPVTIEEGDYAA